MPQGGWDAGADRRPARGWPSRSAAKPTRGCATNASWRCWRAARPPSRQRFDSCPLLSPRQHEEQVGEAVDVAEDPRLEEKAGLLQADHPALGSPPDGAGEVESGRGVAGARDHKRTPEGGSPLDV